MHTEEHAATILLDRGVAWKLPAPAILRLFGKRTIRITVKAIRLGQLLEMSRVYVSMNADPAMLDENPHEFITANMYKTAKLAALCVINTRWKQRLFAGILARFIMNRFTPDMLLEMMLFVINFSGISSFQNTIALFGTMKMTTPKEASPEDQGSLKVEQKDLIAPGD